MNPLELTADMLTRNLEMLKATLADFSDADMLIRPTPGANHAAWQLGHLATSETRMLNLVAPGAAADLPDEFTSRFTKETTSSDDPAGFPGKQELLEAMGKVRAASVRWVKRLSPADLDRSTPERLHGFAPTIGHFTQMLPLHATMHIGQFQVIRRKLGKPILF